jgi:NADH-quinone oxidoreductase subunit H
MPLSKLILHPGLFASENLGPALRELLVGKLGAPEAAFHIACMLIIGAVMAGFVSISAFWLIYMERKCCAYFQQRIGPNRVGPWGLLQTIADAVKLLQKEDLIPEKADRPIFIIAPVISFTAAFMILAVIPFDNQLIVTDLNIGVLYITAVSGLGVLSILMAGWASANKYSLLGGMRSAAQIISYELSPALSVLTVVLFTGTLSTHKIVEAQATGWNLFAMGPMGIIGALIFLTASTAEINRAPFDLPEAESELTAGFSTEYSGMRFSMFYLAEFVNMFIVSAMLTTLFLGGWQPLVLSVPFTSWHSAPMGAFIPGWIWFLLKTYFVIFLIMWFRWTFPRVRMDQLMKLEWKILLPISFGNMALVAVAVAISLAK